MRTTFRKEAAFYLETNVVMIQIEMNKAVAESKIFLPGLKQNQELNHIFVTRIIINTFLN